MNVIFAIVVLLLLAFGLYEGSGLITQVASQPTDGDNVNKEQAPTIPQHIVATDQTTWPSGDRIWDCCRAIAIAEGYQVPGSNPANLNNPGDISDGASVFGFETHSGSNITRFPDAVTGWSWLYTKIKNAASGKSSVYSADMSWLEIGAIWAPPNAQVWGTNVANGLGVDPDSSLGDYVNS